MLFRSVFYQRTNKHTESFAWPLGENDVIHNNYTELTLDCLSGSVTYQLVVRVFDGSVAFRYVLPKQTGTSSGLIRQEHTTFALPGAFTIYQYNEETVFTPTAIADLQKTCDFPATLTNGRLFLSIGEADNANYTKAVLTKGTNPITLAVTLEKDSVLTKDTFKSPWRTVSVVTSAIGLHAFSDLSLRLCPAPAQAVPDWIKPLLTQESIRRNENNSDAFHNTMLPFTRFLVGAADHTFCYPNTNRYFTDNLYKSKLQVSKGQQLALSVVYFSPLQAIFRYGNPTDYNDEGENEFFKRVPTVWNESHYLTGEPGKFISVARRQGNAWYVGSAAGLTDWPGNVSLSFLTSDKRYQATIYEDDVSGGIQKRVIDVKQGDAFSISLKAKAGQAMIFDEKE